MSPAARVNGVPRKQLRPPGIAAIEFGMSSGASFSNLIVDASASGPARLFGLLLRLIRP